MAERFLSWAGDSVHRGDGGGLHGGERGFEVFRLETAAGSARQFAGEEQLGPVVWLVVIARDALVALGVGERVPDAI